MSYENNGLEFEGEGLGALMATNALSTGVRSMQQDLQHLGLLAAGTGSDGADGRWGPTTSGALTRAAQQIGWTGAPFTQRSSTSVEVPDELLARLHAASAAPASPGPTSPSTSLTVDTRSWAPQPTILPSGPGILPTSPGTPTDTAPPGTNWPLIIGGSVAVTVVVGLIAYTLRSAPTATLRTAPAHKRVRRNSKTRRVRRYRMR